MFCSPLIVGTLHSSACLHAVIKECDVIATSGIDFLEIRLDALSFDPYLLKSSLPLIATARHPVEGGEGNMSLEKRRAFLEEALSWASMLDVELRSAEALSPTIKHAHENKRSMILSYHDFCTVPSLSLLNELAERAVDLGADIFKVAATVSNQEELWRLLEFQQSYQGVPVATMGMGVGGKLSRLLLAALGARLSYGWLYHPQIEGQWSARELVKFFKSN